MLNSSEIASLARTGELHDFAPDLAAAPAWAATFQPHSFDALTGDGGEVWAIPQQRDPIGIYYNADQFAAPSLDLVADATRPFPREAAGGRAGGG